MGGIPVLYLIWRSGEPFSGFGLKPPIWGWDLFIGLMIWLVDYFMCTRLWRGFSYLIYFPDSLNTGGADRAHSPRETGDYILLFVASCANGFAEELVMRGYLIPRFERLLGSTWMSVILTAILFGSYHVYQGVSAAIGVAIAGLLYGMLFCFFRRLWPLAMAHALFSFFTILPS